MFVVAAVGVATLAGAAGTPSDRCEAAKLKAAGKKAMCQTKQMAKAVLGGLSDLPKCSTKFADAFGRAETSAGPGVCPTQGDVAVIASFIDVATDGIATALAGVTTTTATPTTVTPTTATTTTVPGGRFIDNGDGTVTDDQTGLQWEKKVAERVPALRRITSRGPPWATGSPEVNGWSADGTTQTGLGGHSDWRPPTSAELRRSCFAAADEPVY
jgi:hypothetical protein